MKHAKFIGFIIVFFILISCANKSKTAGGLDGIIVEDSNNLINLNRSIEGSLVQAGTTENPSYYIATTENKYYWLNNKDPNLLKLKGGEIYIFDGNIKGTGSTTKSINSDDNTITVERALKRDKITLLKKIQTSDPNLNKYSILSKIGNESTPVYFNKVLNYNPDKIYKITGNLYYNGEFRIENPEIEITNYIEVKSSVASKIYPQSDFGLTGHYIGDVIKGDGYYLETNYYPTINGAYNVVYITSNGNPSSANLGVDKIYLINTDFFNDKFGCSKQTFSNKVFYTCFMNTSHTFIVEPNETKESLSFGTWMGTYGWGTIDTIIFYNTKLLDFYKN